jgi:3D (Asp-Asp-Asp) domain-containing protein
MKSKCIRHVKRRYKRIAAAVAAGAALMSVAFAHGLPANIQAAIHPNTGTPPAATQEAQQPQAPDTSPEANAKQVLDITATAYAPGPHDNDQYGSKTYLGTQVRPGVIAVDPRIIPLGSKVLIKYPDGTSEYAVAEDTGGAIKGHRIDIAKWTVNEAKSFGIKPVKVYVLNDNAPGPDQAQA